MSAVSTLHAATTMPTNGTAGVPDDLMERVRAYRIARVRRELVRRNCPAIVLYDPVNIRYATDTSNMQVWTGRNPTRYVIVFVHGPVIGFEFHNCEHVWNGSTLDVELRGATCWNYFSSGPESVRNARQWAREVADLLRQHTHSEMCIAVDRLDPEGVYALQEEGVLVANGQALMEHARAVKSTDELHLVKTAVDVCEQGIQRMHNVLTPGMSEQDLSVAHYMDWDSAGYDGTFESGMTLCIESYIGAEGGDEGVKLEQQVLLTETGCVPLSTFPFETDWL
ncbi:hypothetical protein DF147_35890 [Burkholderia cenocepacia]|nr:hypothetical protein DF147_35890 [Burkholderia cenocepacia]RQU82987.1 hypothetical protein DF133_32965 [Burkholderia cenocepacia]RQV84610.1 hypothetical protein DF019_28890 [Burkholderia cenocepacia]